MNELLNLIPEKFRPWLLAGAVALPYVTRALHALANNGGIKGAWLAIWCGTNTPKDSSSSSSLAGPLLLLALAGGLVLAGPVGCGTTPASKAAQAERLIIRSVNDAMAEWKLCVDTGKATQSQIDDVRHAYKTYVLAQLTAKAVIEKAIASSDSSSESDLAIATNSVNQAEQALLGLVNQFLGRL
jgi:hypothetical protein